MRRSYTRGWKRGRGPGWLAGTPQLAGYALVAFVLLYVTVAGAVFSFRHPWATQTEAFVHMGTVLTFGTVDYEAVRPRGAR